jgi:ketosteroid isomerase-like protein
MRLPRTPGRASARLRLTKPNRKNEMSDIDVVRSGYAAFIAGDMATVRSLFTQDATWTVTGQGRLSGIKRGPDEIMDYFGTLMTLSDGTFHVTLVDLASGDDHVLSIQRTAATRDGSSADQSRIIAWQVRGDRIWQATQYFEDTTANDSFWA